MIAADKYTNETITWTRAWTPNLFSFRLTRSPEFRFTAGQFARLGVRTEDPNALDGSGWRMIWRPYSIVSATYDDNLEFCSVLVPEGEFTSVLGRLGIGDTVYVEKNNYGFLTTERFAPGRDLWMLATGTGLAPFLSILWEKSHWTSYQNLVVVHSVREAAELAYRDTISAFPRNPPFSGLGARLHYLPIVTREPYGEALRDHIPVLLRNNALEAAAGLDLDVAHSRLMLCGNPSMIQETRELLGEKGFATPRRLQPGTLAIEKYW